MTRTPPPAARLRRTVLPHPGEDVRSVAVRYAGIKRLEVPRLLTAGLGLEGRGLTSLPLKPEALAAFANLAGFDLARVRAAAFAQGDGVFEMLGSPASPDMIVPHWRRLAPGMLRADGDQPWIRAHWQIACLPCDPETGERLVQICPGCGSALSWVTVVRMHECEGCRLDLREVEPRLASEREKDLAGLLLGLLRRDPDAQSRMPAVVSGAPPIEQIEFFAWLGCLRAQVQGILIPSGSFATFRGLELALDYPTSLRGLAIDLMSAHEERDPRFGRLVGATELRLRARSLKRGKIRNSVSSLFNRVLKKDEIKGVMMVNAPELKQEGSARAIRFDYQLFLREIASPTRGPRRYLSGLNDRTILLAASPCSLSQG